MKKLLIAGFAVVGLAGSGLAVSYTDVQAPGVTLDTWDTYTGTFNLVNPGTDSVKIGATTYTDAGGFTPGTALSDVTATFWFTDTAHQLPNVSIVLGLGTVDLGAWSGTTQTFSFAGSTGAIDFLENSGHIDYTVGSLFGSFTFADAVLQANTTPITGQGTSNVPDGGVTLGMLGSGFIALVFIQKKKFRL